MCHDILPFPSIVELKPYPLCLFAWMIGQETIRGTAWFKKCRKKSIGGNGLNGSYCNRGLKLSRGVFNPNINACLVVVASDHACAWCYHGGTARVLRLSLPLWAANPLASRWLWLLPSTTSLRDYGMFKLPTMPRNSCVYDLAIIHFFLPNLLAFLKYFCLDFTFVSIPFLVITQCNDTIAVCVYPCTMPRVVNWRLSFMHLSGILWSNELCVQIQPLALQLHLMNSFLHIVEYFSP